MSLPTASTDSQAVPIPVIGLVGGVGSGKSSVARALGAISPVAIIDADVLGHRVLELPRVRDQLRVRFGPGIFERDGKVIRQELAKLVFGDAPAQQQARADLDAITHPEIGRLARGEIEDHQLANVVRWILLDAALLLEADWSRYCDLIVYIDVTPERRLEHVIKNRGWTAEQWRQREASQWPVERKRSAAAIVIDNNGSLDDAARQLLTALEHWQSRSRQHSPP